MPIAKKLPVHFCKNIVKFVVKSVHKQRLSSLKRFARYSVKEVHKKEITFQPSGTTLHMYNLVSCFLD